MEAHEVYPLMIKINVPELKASKLMKFESSDTIEEVINRICKHVVITNISQYGLFLPPQDTVPGSTPNGVWLQPGTILHKYKLVTMKTNLDFKKRAADSPPAVTQAPSTPVLQHTSSSAKMTAKPSNRPPSASVSTPAFGTAPIKEEKSLIRVFLNRFFEARPSQEELIQKRVLRDEIHAGTPIPLRMDIVEKMIAFVESKGITTEGIYRISGLAIEIRKLEQSFRIPNFDLGWVQNVHTACSAFKLYFREMTPPLVPYELYQSFLETADVTDDKQRIIAMRRALEGLPTLNRQVFEVMSRHLSKIAAQSAFNKMVPTNLAIVVAPTLIKAKTETDPILIVMENEKKCKFLELCLTRTDEVFSNEPIPSVTPAPAPVKVSKTPSASQLPETNAPAPPVPPPMIIPPPPVDDFGYYADLLDLCITGNHTEKLQASKALQSLFIDDASGQFAAYMEEIVTKEKLAKVLTNMATALAAFQ